MKLLHLRKGFSAVLVLGAALMLVMGGAPPVQASTEDAALFYEELSQHGSWIEYENHGPVWHPNGVNEDWRPYVEGRWVPSEQGYLFETNEPWGWATYHYGNWMPTEGYGWVWVPGRTWYPNTVTWRTTPDDAPVDTAYVAWAPIPPPNYVPPPAYYPANYSPGMDPLSLIASPLFVFARAASFLLGFGQPFSPAYSYGGCGCLAPPTYYPVIYPRTFFLNNWYQPTYYPPLYGVSLMGAYAWGPRIPWVARYGGYNQVVINNYINNVNVINIRNVYPPRNIIDRHPPLKQIVPPIDKKWPTPQPVKDIKKAGLVTPGAIKPPTGVKPIAAGTIPKATVKPVAPGLPAKSLGVPGKAQQTITPKMADQIKKMPAEGPKPGVKPGVQPGVKPDMKPGMKPGFKPDMKPGAKPGVTPGIKPESKPGPRVEPRPGVRPDVKPGVKPDVRPKPRPEMRPETRPKVRPETKPRPPDRPVMKPQPPPRPPQQMRPPQAPPKPQPQVRPPSAPRPPAAPKPQPAPQPKGGPPQSGGGHGGGHGK